MMNVNTIGSQCNTNIAGRALGNGLRKAARRFFIATACAGGILTGASLYKTPTKTLNPSAPTTSYYTYNPKYPASSNVMRIFYVDDFKYDKSKSIMNNVKYNTRVANNKLFDYVVDPIAEHPVIPTTATALALLGVAATKPKKDNAIQQEEVQTEAV